MAIIRPIEEAHASNWARRCQRNDTVLRGTMGEATRHQSGSCPRIAQRSWAFRRRGPADPAVRPALQLGAHAVSPAQLLRTWWLLAMGILVVLAGCGYEFGTSAKPGAARGLQLAVPVFHNDTF